MLTHDHDRDVLERFIRGPALYGAVSARSLRERREPGAWPGDDRNRPLDEQGWFQARELVRSLSQFDVDEIISADFVRCIQTVQPLSEAIGVLIRERPLFRRKGYPAHEDEAEHLLRKLGERLETSRSVARATSSQTSGSDQREGPGRLAHPAAAAIKKGSFLLPSRSTGSPALQLRVLRPAQTIRLEPFSANSATAGGGLHRRTIRPQSLHKCGRDWETSALFTSRSRTDHSRVTSL